MLAEVRQRLSLSKQAPQRFDMERFNFKNVTLWKSKNSIRLKSRTGLQV